jgi:hypothetical protein
LTNAEGARRSRRFGMYMPPLLEALGPEVEHNPRNNRMRAI